MYICDGDETVLLQGMHIPVFSGGKVPSKRSVEINKNVNLYQVSEHGAFSVFLDLQVWFCSEVFLVPTVNFIFYRSSTIQATRISKLEAIHSLFLFWTNVKIS